jgi:hypothetical protein
MSKSPVSLKKVILIYKLNCPKCERDNFSCKAIKAIKNYSMQKLLLLGGDIEENPGPKENKVELILMTQNCRGLKEPNKLRYLLRNKKKLVKNEKFILALQETYLMNDNSIKWSGNYVFTGADSPHSAGCITFLNDFVRILDVKHIDDKGHGHVIAVEGLNMHVTIIANIYSPVRSLARDQEIFYEELVNIIEELELKYVLNEPELIVLGDFNLPLEMNFSHNSKQEKERARQLAECFQALGLIDCWKQGDNRITYKTGLTRLDRILYRTSRSVREKLDTEWTFIPSDHCLLKLTLMSSVEKNSTRRTISLPTYLLDHRDAVELIDKGMMEMASFCNEGWEASFKLEYLKMSLRTVVGEVVKQMNKKVNDELEVIQKEISRRLGSRGSLPLSAHEENKLELDLLFAKRNFILEERSKKLAEKSKTKWFYEGEKSNKYFLNLLRQRRNQTDIVKLKTLDGEVMEGDKINKEVTNFYRNLYENGSIKEPEIDENYFELVNKVNESEANKVVEIITKEELYNVLQTCNDSAPGPDGIPYSYYKHFWKFFGDTLVQTWQESIMKGSLPASHTTSMLRLLPKPGKDLSRLSNWRPITLSNCDHKLITKCLARRLTNVLTKYLHPNQTAYLPGKQIQDNLRILNMVNKHAPETLITALDARKAFDSVSHDYIRKTLMEYGLSNFIPIFNLLYRNQKVDILVNNDSIKGYEIKNGVKQGDSLSCILFILCIDPLIRNIEHNNYIERVEINGYPVPKILAYADDVTCITLDAMSIKEIFKEYERLSKASGLVLNAEKTEILDNRERRYKVTYQGERHVIKSCKEVKINGILYHKDRMVMGEKNFAHIVEKIKSMLAGWRARGLSLLGRILIYKTFGLSQVIYILSVIDLNAKQHKQLDTIFNNFIWGRALESDSTKFRISRARLCTPLNMGGFGMIQYQDIMEGIYCRQLCKLYDPQYNHPLRSLIKRNDYTLFTGRSLTAIADEMSIRAHSRLLTLHENNLKKLTNDEILNDVNLINQLGELNIVRMIKPRWTDSAEAIRLTHLFNCINIRDVISSGRPAVSLCRKVMKARYFRVIKIFWQNNVRCEPVTEGKLKLHNGCYKDIYRITSKDFRLILQDKPQFANSRICEQLEIQDMKEYFNQIKRLINTRHKNTPLRVWNGDCLSYSRLVHMGLTETNICPNCNAIDTPMHVLVECELAKQVWNKLMEKIPKQNGKPIILYAIGVNDSRTKLAIKAEILKMLMHFRDMNAEGIYRKIENHFLTVSANNLEIQNIFGNID